MEGRERDGLEPGFVFPLCAWAQCIAQCVLWGNVRACACVVQVGMGSRCCQRQARSSDISPKNIGSRPPFLPPLPSLHCAPFQYADSQGTATLPLCSMQRRSVSLQRAQEQCRCFVWATGCSSRGTLLLCARLPGLPRSHPAVWHRSRRWIRKTDARRRPLLPARSQEFLMAYLAVFALSGIVAVRYARRNDESKVCTSTTRACCRLLGAFCGFRR